MTEPADLRANDVSLQYSDTAGPVTALVRVSLHLRSGEFLAIVGPSGCGKTTLLRVLAGLLSPTEGSVTLGQHPVAEPSERIGIIFQQNTLFPWMTAAGNVEFALRSRVRDKVMRRGHAVALLASVGLADCAASWPFSLSGGMAQRATLARALATQPEVLLLDEPFSALDAISRAEMHSLLLDVWSQRRMSLLLVTHDLDEAVALADRVLIMSHRPGTVADQVEVDLPRPRIKEGLRVAGFDRVHNEIAGRARPTFRAARS